MSLGFCRFLAFFHRSLISSLVLSSSLYTPTLIMLYLMIHGLCFWLDIIFSSPRQSFEQWFYRRARLQIIELRIYPSMDVFPWLESFHQTKWASEISPLSRYPRLICLTLPSGILQTEGKNSRHFGSLSCLRFLAKFECCLRS